MQQHSTSHKSSPFVSGALVADNGSADSAIHIGGYLRLLNRHKFNILLIGLIFAFISGLYAFRMTPVYQSQVLLLAAPPELKFSGGSSWASASLIYFFYQTQKQIIESRRLALSVVDELHLVEYYKKRAEEAEKNQTKFLGLDWRLWFPGAGKEGTASRPTLQQQREAAAARLDASLSVELAKDSQVISINYDSDDPKMAAAIVQAVAENYRDFGLKSRIAKAGEQTTFLNKQLKVLVDKVDKAEAALRAYQEREGLLDTTSAQQIITAQLSTLATQLVDAEAKRNDAQVRYQQAQRLQRGRASYDSLAEVLNNPLIGTLRARQADLEQRVSELSEKYGPKYPKMIAAKAELAAAKRALASQIGKVVAGLKQAYQVASQQEAKIRGMLNQSKEKIQGLQAKNFQLAQLERDVDSAREVYNQFLKRANQMDVEKNYDISNVTIIDNAEVSSAPIKPHKLRWVIGGFLFGILVGAILAFLREQMDTTIKLVEQLDDKLKLPGLGMMPLLRKGKASGLSPERAVEAQPNSPFSEAINHVRTGLLFTSETPPQVVLVTSSTAAEGKTTFACNLAASFSRLGRTLLVELDLRKPRLANVYGIKSKGGVTDLADDPGRAGELIVRIDQARDIYVLPAGTLVSNPLEFLSSDKFAHLLDMLRKKFDHIILDAPPVLPVSDAIVVAKRADAVVLMVRSEQAHTATAKQTLKQLRAAHVAPVGAVLSFADTKKMAAYGGHYYGYHAYYGTASDKSKGAAV